MSVLQMCWLAVTGATIIFLVVAAISALPKMKAVYTASIASIFLAASGITAFGSLAPILAEVGISAPAAQAAAGPMVLPAAPVPGAPLANDASAGKVVFTFDDGPDSHTPEVIAELNALHVKGVFFMIGDKAQAHQQMVVTEVAYGEVVGNHTWDHKSLTGKGTGTKPLSQDQVRDELTKANTAIVAAGAPQPTLWRPPYGAVDNADVVTANALGLRVVLDSGTNILDSNDWAGLTAAQIAARVDPVLKDQTIIAFHDGLTTAPNTIAALPLIVAYMNAHHLGSTTTVRPDATGGVVNDNRPATETTGNSPPATTPAASAPATSAPVAAFTAPAAAAGGFTPAPVPAAVQQAASQPAAQPVAQAPAPVRTTPAPVKTTTAPAPPPTTPAPPPTTPAPDPTPTTTAPAPDPTVSTTTPAPVPTGTSTVSGAAA